MKVVFGLFVFLALVGACLYFFGGLSGYDPAKQGEDFHAAVKPGLTWQQVLDIQVPRTFCVMDYGNQYDLDGRSASRKFDEAAFRQSMQNNAGPADGFIFEYVFDAEHAYDVYFDGSGNVTMVQEAITTSDLLNGGMGD